MGNARGNDITFTFEETRLFFVQIGAHANCDKYHAQSSKYCDISIGSGVDAEGLRGLKTPRRLRKGGLIYQSLLVV